MDLAGGTLDIWPVGMFVPHAATVNAAISLRAQASVRPSPRIRVVSSQRGLDAVADHADELFEQPFTALAGRLCAFFQPPEPVEIRFHTTAPPGSGLGGSSALGMAIAAALNEACGAGWTTSELARIVMDTEVRILRTSTGSQDQFAAGLGGVHALHWETPAPRAERLPWGADGEDPLSERFVLVFSGEEHSSAAPNRSVLDRISAGEIDALRGIGKIAEAALGMREALLARDWTQAAAMLDREWAARRMLSPAVTTPTLDRLESRLRSAGALAVKACGAGGGGTVVAMTEPERRTEVMAAATAAGGQVLDVRTERAGLRRAPLDALGSDPAAA